MKKKEQILKKLSDKNQIIYMYKVKVLQKQEIWSEKYLWK